MIRSPTFVVISAIRSAAADRITPPRSLGAGNNTVEVSDPRRSLNVKASAIPYGQRTLSGLLGPGARAFGGIERRVRPIWREVTEGEPRWPVSIALAAAIVLQLLLPDRLSVYPRWMVAGLEGALLLGLIRADTRRIETYSPNLRVATVALILAISLVNAWSAVRLIRGLMNKTEPARAAKLLRTGGSIWLTSVIVFALWCWELDRGGPAARSHAVDDYPDFLFPQTAQPEVAPPGWEAGFIDYFYLSFTNASAFSPTDVLPLSRWAKLTMLVPCVVSLVTVVLVVARAVNILG
jgi:hypothetical protein